jgi:hypothetical protein
MPVDQIKPTWEHANSRFMCVTLGVIDELQTIFLNGSSLDNKIPGIDRNKAAVIVAESLEADRVLHLSTDQLLFGSNQGPVSDFKTAILAEILFLADQIDRQQNRYASQVNHWALAMASLEKIGHTPTASPLLWYEDIYWELAQVSRKDAPDEALNWLKRNLAHNLRFNSGNNGLEILRDLADIFLEKGEIEHGLHLLTVLLHNAPDNIWIYNQAAISFDQYGLAGLGVQATKRGLQLLDAKGDPEELQPQLEDCLQTMQSDRNQNHEADIPSEVKESFEAALKLDFDAGRQAPINNLCRELVPDLGHTFVKKRLTPAQFPLPDREKILQHFSPDAVKPLKKNTRRRRRKRRR